MLNSTENYFDFVVIGAGVVGCAIAREITKYSNSVALIDRLDDVGADTSKANTAILHTGFDMKPGTLESRLVREGYELLYQYAKDNQISVEETGAILVAWNETELAELDNILENAKANNYLQARKITSSEIYEFEPNLNPGALGGLLIPNEYIIDPWSVSISFASQAIKAGLKLFLNTKVLEINRDENTFNIKAENRTFATKFIINAAGLYSDKIDDLLGFDELEITPRRGELIVFDKLARKKFNHIILPVPTKMGKGVLISPTIFGNVMLGPTAVDVKDKEDKRTTQEGLETLLNKGNLLSSSLIEEEVTSTYAGLRAASNQSDYFIKYRKENSSITVGGIRSTGLTSSLAIGKYVVDLLKQSNLLTNEINNMVNFPMPVLGEAFNRAYKDEAKISQNPSYGEIICHCERVTKQELIDALNSTIPPQSLGGLSRRTRVCLGRCQGFYCLSEVRKLIAENSKEVIS